MNYAKQKLLCLHLDPGDNFQLDYFQCFMYHMTKLKRLFIEVGIHYPTLGFTVLQENVLFLGGQVIKKNFFILKCSQLTML